MAECFGGKVIRAPNLVHGKSSKVSHKGAKLFEGLPNPFEAGRYHSLIVEGSSLPDQLEVTAESHDGELMALRHREWPLHGVQFHPESILTPDGKRILANFISF